VIDKSKRKASAQRNGSIVAIHMTGGPDCLWLNMYLDTEAWQMTCDSDIGSYSYRWSASTGNNSRNFDDFCVDWFSNEEWLLRKCIGERHVEVGFDAKKSHAELVRAFIEDNGSGCDTYNLLEALDVANGYDTAREWIVALATAADQLDVCLPDEWVHDCIVRDYTPWQKRFAEICREVIVPELVQLLREDS